LVQKPDLLCLLQFLSKAILIWYRWYSTDND